MKPFIKQPQIIQRLEPAKSLDEQVEQLAREWSDKILGVGHANKPIVEYCAWLHLAAVAEKDKEIERMAAHNLTCVQLLQENKTLRTHLYAVCGAARDYLSKSWYGGISRNLLSKALDAAQPHACPKPGPSQNAVR